MTEVAISWTVTDIAYPLYKLGEAPTPSTQLSSTQTAKRQKHARVIVSTNESMSNIIYDSSETNLDSRRTALPIDLAPRTRYYWQVTVTANNGETATSNINWFETAKMQEEWQAKWITSAWEKNNFPQNDDCVHPYIRAQFDLTKKIVTARAYITGLGLYELHINGNRISDEYFAPYCTVGDAWTQYQTYDITQDLQSGKNAIAIMLANGWAKGKFGVFMHRNEPYTNRFVLLAEFHVTYEDGTAEVLGTNNNWLCHPSPVLYDNMYNGVVYDATQEIDGWNNTHLDETAWQNTHELISTEHLAYGEITARLSPPVKIMEEIKTINYIRTPACEDVLDLGQNMVGWLRFNIKAPSGTKIKITHAEIMQRGNFYTENLRTAKQEYIYIANGTAENVQPRFAFYGFRFAKVEVTSPDGTPIALSNNGGRAFTADNFEMTDITGCVLYSQLETIGHIETSDARVNKLFQNAMWGQKGNFLDVPTDCPQRDERMGWTGDTQVFAGTAMFNMHSYPFYVKFMHDLYKEQIFCGGYVPSTIPQFVKRRPMDTNDWTGGGCAWGDCATIVPWEVYLHSGDKAILQNQYQSMKEWVNWITRKCEKDDTGYLWRTGFHYGDWLALDGEKDEHGKNINPFGATDTGFLASAFYRRSSMLVSKAAAVLGRTDDALKYAALSQRIRTAIQERYFNADGTLTTNTQTAHIIAIQFDLANNKEQMLAGLKALLEANNMFLATGFIGTPFLCRVLSDYGDSESAYKIFLNDELPSWLYAVDMDATTIWERWNSVMPDGLVSDTGMNSLNHYAYGSIAEWMYRNMCGIKPIEDTPGFKRFTLKPEPNTRLTFARGQVDTAMGIIKCGWEYKGDSIEITASVPFNTEAELILPNGDIHVLAAGEYVIP